MSCGRSTHASTSSSIREPPNRVFPTSEGRACSATSCTTKPNTTVAPTTANGCHHGRSSAISAIDDDPVEDPARVVGVSQRLERPVDQHRADRDTDQTARPSEDDHRVHGDQQDEVEVRRKDGALDRREDRTRNARHACPHGESHQLEAADGHRHQLGRELVLAKGPPGPTGSRLIQEVEEGDDEDEGDEGDVEVAVERGDLLPEELKRVEIRDPVRPARPGGVDEDDQPELEEEEGHDREVVADETPRGKPDQEAGDGSGDGNERDRDRGIPMATRVLGGERERTGTRRSRRTPRNRGREGRPSRPRRSGRARAGRRSACRRRPASGRRSRRGAGRPRRVPRARAA